MNRIVKRGRYFTLSFEFTFLKNEKIWLALTVPYRFSDLTNFLGCLPSSVTQEILCRSLSGVDVPLITITDNEVPDSNKKFIVVIARAHPSETVGSWIVQGFMDYLTRNERIPKKLIKIFVFKIVPMTNPDGVILGNSRVNLSGSDQNRIYGDPDMILHPVNYAVKKLVEDLAKSPQGIQAFFDIHGHFRKKGSFMYGPHFPLHSEKHCRVRVLPRLISEQTPMFRYYSCKYRSEKSKQNAARIVFSKEMGIANCYTFENSLYGYIDEERNTHVYTLKHLETLAHHLGNSLYQFHLMLSQEDLEKEEKAKSRAKKRKKPKKRKEDHKLLFKNKDQIKTLPNLDMKKILITRNEKPIHTMKEIISMIKQDQKEESSSASSQSDSEDTEDNAQARNIVISAMKEFDKLTETKTNIKEIIYKSTASIPPKSDKKKPRSKTPGKRARSSSLLKMTTTIRSLESKKLPSVRLKLTKVNESLESSLKVNIPKIETLEASTRFTHHSKKPGSDPTTPAGIDSSFDLNKRIRTPHHALNYFGRNHRIRHHKTESKEENKNQITMINMTDIIGVDEQFPKVKKRDSPSKNENQAKYHKFGPFPSIALFNARILQFM